MANVTSKEISDLIDGICSEPEIKIKTISSLVSAESNSVSFFADRKYSAQLKTSKAGLMILRKEDSDIWPGPAIFVEDPYLAFAKVSNFFKTKAIFETFLHASAVISKTSILNKESRIGPNVVVHDGAIVGSHVTIDENTTIGKKAIIGAGTKIHSNVYIGENVRIGLNCEIFPGAAIGVDGFGYALDKDMRWIKIPQIGSVHIGDNVDIGANTTIDRGTLDDTIIKTGVKIDNQVQIGHNCLIDENTIIAGCVGIAGSAVVGKNCKIGGAAMILGHLTIADNVIVSPGTMITKSLNQSGRRYTSITPFLEHKKWLRYAANIKKDK